MYKFNTLFATLFTVLFLVGCGESRQTKEAEVSDAKETSESSSTTGAEYTVDLSNSKIEWEGEKKFTNAGHNGVISLKNGTFKIEDGAIQAGNFVIDMKTLQNTDLEDSPEDQKKLEGHLKSEDFFHVSKYPEAKFELTSIEPLENDNAGTHSVNGNLTLKDVTKNISFPAEVEMGKDKFKAQAEFHINRTDFNVKYGSKTFNPDLVKDKIIKDQIHLNLHIVANKQTS